MVEETHFFCSALQFKTRYELLLGEVEKFLKEKDDVKYGVKWTEK